MPTVIATEHRIIRSIGVADVSGELSRLERRIPTPIGISAPWVEFNCADNISVHVRGAFALGDRIFMHPVNAALLHRQQTTTLIYKTAHPVAATVHLGNYLPAEHTGTKVISCIAVFILAGPQAIAIIILLDGHVTGECLLSGRVIGESLS